MTYWKCDCGNVNAQGMFSKPVCSKCRAPKPRHTRDGAGRVEDSVQLKRIGDELFALVEAVKELTEAVKTHGAKK